jgi:lipoprotein-anchoring transpeptidase ErfK/SrfK
LRLDLLCRFEGTEEDVENTMLRISAIVWSALLSLAGQHAGAAAPLDPAGVNGANLPTAGGAGSKLAQAAVIKAQGLLDRAGFSPGEISGRLEENTRKAIGAFEAQAQLPVDGKLGADLWMALTATSDEPVLTDYVIRGADVRGPFLKALPGKMEAMKNLERLSYTSPREALAEKFHMSEALLAALNPGKSFATAGTVIAVANVAQPPGPKVTRIEIDKPQHQLRAYGANDDLVAVFPASIGSTEKPAPSGTFKVASVTHNPTYRYDPAYAFKGVKAKQPFTIKPGPNNPVGTVWIGLTAMGYGIHGAPDPAKVGKTASHGCIRLTNWDAEKLAAMIGKGLPVVFLDASDAAQATPETLHRPAERELTRHH